MGGRGSGGRRVGSGQKGKLRVLRPPARGAASTTITTDEIPGTFDPPAELQETPGQLAKLVAELVFLHEHAGPGEPNPQIAEIQARVDELTARALALAIWHELAPSAFAARTLTPATTAAFVMLCRAVVQERALSASVAAGGPNHRGLMHRVATWMKDFCLSPFGKPLYDAQPVAKVVSKWAGLLK